MAATASGEISSWTQAPGAPSQVRVLLAEEDDFFRWVLDRLLGEAGYEVTPVGTGRGLLGHLARSFDGLWSSIPHVVVASVGLPEIGGLEVLERLSAAGWRAPFILVSEGPDEALRQRAWGAGASYLLHKPFDPERLVGAVGDLAKEARRQDR